MHDPPARQRRKGKTTYGKQKSNLTLFGRWTEVLNKACQTNQAGIALRTGIDKSMLSKATRGKSNLQRDTVLKLLHVYEDMVHEQQIELPSWWQHLFFLAWSGDELLTKEANEIVEELEKIYDP